MKILKPQIFASIFLLLSGSLYLNSLKAVTSKSAPAPCVVGRTAAPIGFWTWPANSKVNIYLREPDFSAAEIPAVRTAVENWDVSAAENGSQVHFTMLGLTRETKTGPGDMTLIRGHVYDSKVRHLALLRAQSLKSNQLIDYALVIVDFRVKSLEVLTNVMAHEIGHSLGLLDCPQCKGDSTAMALLDGGDNSNGIEGPTACDKVEVLAAYKELRLHARAAPTTVMLKNPLTDPSEQPEANDTPIVLKPIAALTGRANH
jgi:hypothetical protein